MKKLKDINIINIKGTIQDISVWFPSDYGKSRLMKNMSLLRKMEPLVE